MKIIALSPYFSVFDTQEEQVAYDKRASKKLVTSDTDDMQGMPYDQFMAK